MHPKDDAHRIAFYCLKATRWIDNIIDRCPPGCDKQLALKIREDLALLYGRYYHAHAFSQGKPHATSRQTE